MQRLKAKREVIFRRAEKYVSQYRKIQSDKVRAQKVAKTTGQVYVPAEAKVLFVVRIRGFVCMTVAIWMLFLTVSFVVCSINGISPKPRKVLQLFRLRQINNGVFLKVNKATVNMLRLIEPYVTYGFVVALRAYLRYVVVMMPSSLALPSVIVCRLAFIESRDCLVFVCIKYCC